MSSILNNCFSTGSYFPGFESAFSFTSELLVALNDSSTQVLSYSFDPTLTSDSKSLDDIITQTVLHIQGILIEINNRAASVSLNPHLLPTLLSLLRIGLFGTRSLY